MERHSGNPSRLSHHRTSRGSTLGAAIACFTNGGATPFRRSRALLFALLVEVVLILPRVPGAVIPAEVPWFQRFKDAYTTGSVSDGRLFQTNGAPVTEKLLIGFSREWFIGDVEKMLAWDRPEQLQVQLMVVFHTTDRTVLGRKTRADVRLALSRSYNDLLLAGIQKCLLQLLETEFGTPAYAFDPMELEAFAIKRVESERHRILGHTGPEAPKRLAYTVYAWTPERAGLAPPYTSNFVSVELRAGLFSWYFPRQRLQRPPDQWVEEFIEQHHRRYPIVFASAAEPADLQPFRKALRDIEARRVPVPPNLPAANWLRQLLPRHSDPPGQASPKILSGEARLDELSATRLLGTPPAPGAGPWFMEFRHAVFHPEYPLEQRPATALMMLLPNERPTRAQLTEEGRLPPVMDSWRFDLARPLQQRKTPATRQDVWFSLFNSDSVARAAALVAGPNQPNDVLAAQTGHFHDFLADRLEQELHAVLQRRCDPAPDWFPKRHEIRGLFRVQFESWTQFAREHGLIDAVPLFGRPCAELDD